MKDLRLPSESAIEGGNLGKKGGGGYLSRSVSSSQRSDTILTALLRSLRRPSIRTAIGTIALTGCLCVTSLNSQLYAAGEPGADGTAGTAGTAQTTTVNTLTGATGTTWGDAGTAGGTAGAGAFGMGGWPANMGGESYNSGGTAGGKGGDGGKGGQSGASGALTVNVSDGGDDLNFSSLLFGANGVAGAAGGAGAKGGTGGGFNNTYTTQINGANGGVGGLGGLGADGANGGTATFHFNSGTSIFAANTLFGGTGGQGGAGGTAGQGGNGGLGIPAQKGFADFFSPTIYPDHNGGNGGNGGDGGIGGAGGNGGNGGNAQLTVGGGTVTFGNGVQFGGNGGKGGNGGVGGSQGIAGIAGAASDPNSGYTGTAGANGNLGAFGNGGAGGAGGNAGNGTLIITSGTANFLGTAYFGGQAGTGGNGGAAGGTGATAGAAGITGTAASGSKLEITGGTVNLGGNITFRGTNNTVSVGNGSLGSGTIAIDGNRTIDVGTTGTAHLNGGSTLAINAGTLSIVAGTVSGPAAAGKIVLDALASGDFLTTSVAGTNLTTGSFDVSGYGDGGAELTQTGNTFNIKINTVAQNLTWAGTNGDNWQTLKGEADQTWKNARDEFKDFKTTDNVTFTATGAGTVNLVGGVAPTNTNVTGGDYTFAGTGAITTGTVNVYNGASVTFANTGNNSYGNTNIANGGTVTAQQSNSLGTGTITNDGTLNLAFNGGELANSLAGTGIINKDGTGVLTLSGESSVMGGTFNVNTGSLLVTGSYGGNIVSDADVVFNRNTDSAYAGNLTGAGQLIKEGTGALTLSGSAVAGVEINNGSIVLGNAAALGAGADVNTNGTLDVNGIAPTSPIGLNGGSLVNNSATAATVNNVALDADSKVGGSGNLTIDNALAGGFDLEKTGTGTTTLTQDNDLGTTTVSGGKLQLTGNGTAGDNVVLGTGTSLIANGVAAVASDISGAGSVDVLKDTTLTGTISYTGGTNVIGSTLTGNLPNGGDLSLTNANYDLGGANRTIGTLNTDAASSVILGADALTIANGGTLGGQITGTGNTNLTGGTLTITETGSINSTGLTTIGAGTTLEATLVQDASQAALQNGHVTFENGSTVKGNLIDGRDAYTISAGSTTNVYLGNNVTLDGNLDGVTVANVGNRFFVVDAAVGKNGLLYQGNQLYYLLKRRFGHEMFPNSPSQIYPVIDNYGGGNDFIENLASGATDDATIEFYGLSAFDLVNLSNAMSALYDTQTGINNTLYNRSQMLSRASRFGGSCDPCGSCNSGSDRQIWATPFYGNSRGFGLNTGNFRHGYVNDQYGISFGIDKAYGQTSFGVMGIGGGGKVVSRGQLARTENETGFGGVYFYSNTRSGSLDALLTAGWLGMENDVTQYSYGGKMSGKVSTGLTSLSATLTKTYKYDGLRLLPSFGIEYGYYHQGSMTASWGGQTSFYNEKADTNLAVIPVGIRIQRDGVAFGGRLTPEIRARYIANVGSVSSAYKTWMTGSPTSALMATRMTDRHAGDLGLGFGWTRQDVSFRGDVGYMFSEHYGDLSVSATGAWKF